SVLHDSRLRRRGGGRGRRRALDRPSQLDLHRCGDTRRRRHALGGNDAALPAGAREGGAMKRPGSKKRGARLPWYLLIHQLPPEPLYLRAKIRQRLARVGAVALKNAVYALPQREECLEDFQWIAEEAISGGGEAYVCEAHFLEARTDGALVEQFRAERDAD